MEVSTQPLPTGLAMKQSFKIELNTESPNAMRAELEVRSKDGNTVVHIFTPVPADALTQSLAVARAMVLRSVIQLLQEQSQTP